MKARPLGCLTVSGLIAAVLTALAILAASAASGNAIFSAGLLSDQTGGEVLGGVSSHADLAGNCAACHPAFWSETRMQDRCLVCHRNVADELRQAESMHADFVLHYTCRTCHPEHRGASAELTTFEFVVFPHDEVGFSLRLHRSVEMDPPMVCRTCHPESVRQFEQASCRACHLKIDQAGLVEHINTFHPNCLGCHDGLDRYPSEFDHQLVDFQLQGGHLQVPCAGCHQDASSVLELQATTHSCEGCHLKLDIHEGRLGSACDQCHVPQDWRQATIDHDLTAFALIGAHERVFCEGCHVDRQWAGLATGCYGCHGEQDEHDGRYGTRCDACHAPTEWSEVTFDHALSAFPLTGAHASAICESCHLQGRFESLPTACVACHADPAYHAGLLGTNCASCHSTSAWYPASFNRPHSFPLRHGSAGSSCGTCHPGTLAAYTCYGCHEHNRDKVQREHREEGIGNISNCLRCHPGGREAD